MYNPYGNAAADLQQNLPQQNQYQFQAQQRSGLQQQPANLQYPQPQHPTFQQNQFGLQNQQHQQNQHQPPAAGAANPNVYANFFNDPATSLASQFARSGFESSNQYLQQNFGSFIPGTSDLKYYFQVSNSYVTRKILLVLFPYRNKNWNRLTSQEATGDPSPNGQTLYAPPSHDVNAPDLYIPLMSFVTYILLWAAFQGLNEKFHPKLFGYLASQTLAFSVVDIAFFKIGLYLLNCSQSSMWDLVAFSSYKYVVIIVLLCWKHLVGNGWVSYFPVVIVLTINLAVFLMRSLKFLVLPNSSATANSVTVNQRRIRVQFLFVYSVIVQGLIILYMSR